MSEDFNNGWIKLPRSVRDSRFWPKTRRYTDLEALLDLKLMASHRPSKVTISSRTILIPADGFLTSQVKLAKRWHWNRRTVSKFLRFLNTLEILRIETEKGIDHGYTMITFQNSIDFDAEEESDSPVAGKNKIPFECTSSAHKQEGKDNTESVRKNSLYETPQSDSPSDSEDGVLFLGSGGAAGSEQCLIGAVLREPSTIAGVASILKPEDFSDPAVAKSFGIILALHQQRRTVDVLTLETELKELGIARPTGADLVDWAAAASTSDIMAYAESIRILSNSRNPTAGIVSDRKRLSILRNTIVSSQLFSDEELIALRKKDIGKLQSIQIGRVIALLIVLHRIGRGAGSE